MSMVHTERVLVVPAAEFHKLGHFQGVTTEVDRYLGHLLQPELVSYRPRGEMEEDPSFKQLIPYVIFQYDDAQGDRWLFNYTRGSGQGESRLHQKISIGVGGHISVEDACETLSGNPYHEGMRRELEEEVIIESDYTDECVGMINDDETEVGKVHLGIVHIFRVREPQVRSREDEMHQSGFERLEVLQSRRDAMESWSRICLDALYGNG